MTIEEKAKAYDEALERARKWEGNPAAVDYIFPKIKESEDEKITNEIVDFICWATDRGSITKEQREKSNSWLAWLEKQKPVNKDFEDAEEIMIYQGEKYTRCYKDALDKFACKYPKTVPPPSKKYAKYSDTDLVIAVKAGAE